MIGQARYVTARPLYHDDGYVVNPQKHGAKSRPVDVAEAFDTQRDLMTQARNLKVVS